MNHDERVFSARVILQLIFFIILVPMLPLIISRQWDWLEAWVYAILYILSFMVSRILAARRNPDLIIERSKITRHENTIAWDKILAPSLGVLGILILLVIGLDALLGWSPPFNPLVKIISLIAILLGYALGSYALIENRFFSGVVRLQTERGHQVVSSGPYRWLRHPGYAGGLLTYLATPFFLDSSWAILPAILMMVVMVIRTNLEDRFLQDELQGYREYASRVRYRLLPGIW